MSKQALARELIDLGCPLAFNTLRKYPLAHLEAMVDEAKREFEAHYAAQEPAIEQTPFVDTPVESYVPTDAELYTLPVVQDSPSCPPEPQKDQQTWLGLAMRPWAILCGIMGL